MQDGWNPKWLIHGEYPRRLVGVEVDEKRQIRKIFTQIHGTLEQLYEVVQEGDPNWCKEAPLAKKN